MHKLHFQSYFGTWKKDFKENAQNFFQAKKDYLRTQNYIRNKNEHTSIDFYQSRHTCTNFKFQYFTLKHTKK